MNVTDARTGAPVFISPFQVAFVTEERDSLGSPKATRVGLAGGHVLAVKESRHEVLAALERQLDAGVHRLARLSVDVVKAPLDPKARGPKRGNAKR